MTKNAITTGVLAAALAVGFAGFAPATVPTAHATDNGSDQPVTDTWITTKVKSELATTDGVKSMDIDVKTVDGVVTLTGTLATDVAVKKAIAAAESIKGVVITEVAPDSAAAERGIVPGDVIVEIGQEAVTTADEVKTRVAKLKSEDRRNALMMIANHTGALRYITVRID